MNQNDMLFRQSYISTSLKIVRGPLGAPKARGPLGVALTPTTVRYATALNLRRWSRRLALFFKIVNNLTPEYTREPIPPLPQSNYLLRRPAIIRQIRARTMSFGASFYPNCLSQWNKLDSEIRQLPTLGMFKKKLFTYSSPTPTSLQYSRPERLSNSNTTSCRSK